MSEPIQTSEPTETLVAQSGSYELLKARLAEQGRLLQQKTSALNEARLAEFGRAAQSLVLRTRARTQNNCVPRDLTRIGDLLLFGYNVFIGLRKETAVADVFSLYRFSSQDGAEELEPVSLDGTFLQESRFVADFRELYTYYKQASLTQLRVHQHKLFAVFQIGQQIGDTRVFRWSLENDGSVKYIDNRGEREVALPPAHDFEWTPTTRENHVGGRHPHVNILDTVFVETIGGDLTVKIENNTETGLGVYSEPVEDRNQSLADADIAYARLGSLILLCIRPYREKENRYLVFNTRTNSVVRIDAIGQSCVQLPEDHGIIFPGGYYLQSGQYKQFDLPAELTSTLLFKRMLRSPNGEDVLYVFYQPGGGRYALFSYNLIEKSLATPLICNGYARFDDGRLLIFQADNPDPTRTHPMQLWQTPFCSDDDDAARRSAKTNGFFGRIGNPELVRGIADLSSIARAVSEQTPTRAAYEEIIRQCNRVQDAFFWLSDDVAGNIDADLRSIVANSHNTLDEFEKVETIRRDTRRAIDEAESRQRELMTDIASTIWQKPNDFVEVLDRMREHRGRLQMLKELRYADVDRIAHMDAVVGEEQQRVSGKALDFLAQENAFNSTRNELEHISGKLPLASTSEDVAHLLADLDRTASGLDLLTEQIGNLPGGNAVVRTQILDSISTVYAEINRLRAETRNRRRSLSVTEAAAEFGAQFKLFGQSLENAVDLADTPEKCDDALTRLLAQLEEMEGRFAEQEEFLTDIATKREAVYEAMLAKRQTLLDARQRRTRAIIDAANRILAGVPRRINQLSEVAQVHSYFVSDPLIEKLRGQINDLRGLGDGVAADDLDTKLKTARDQAIGSVRDKSELAAGDGSTIRLGRHAFTINRQVLDLALVPREGVLNFHLSGTDYFAPLADPRFAELKPWWDQLLVSETPDLYRAEYLAVSLLDAVITGEVAFDWPQLLALCADTTQSSAALLEQVRVWSTSRYQEGYQKGVHDIDAARILAALVNMQSAAGLLSYGPDARALAMLYWQFGCNDEERTMLLRQANAAIDIRLGFGVSTSLKRLGKTLADSLRAFAPSFDFNTTRNGLGRQASRYLIRQLAALQNNEGWVIAGVADDLATDLQRHLEASGQLADWQRDLEGASAVERWRLARDWVTAYAARHTQMQIWAEDAASRFALDMPRKRVNADLDVTLTGMLGEHPRIVSGELKLNLHDSWRRYLQHADVVVAGFNELQTLRHEVLVTEKRRLKLEQFQAKPLSSFVRNRLIDEVYLPLIGDNLAKQIGAAGDAARSDRMGLLLLISPPGYGKTTLMEYVADRLGMIFVRINCPALGHGVTALDPSAAGNGAARQELEKLNLGLLMGNNVMLYLDDIQHTNPEFLQKFIALADGTRRIEAVHNGESVTCDLRGKRFAIVMAGNPYTESGEVFKIPDMLANRADIYNLGDVLAGREALFALSYIENSLTSNPILLPLASREPKDVHLLVRMAEGENIQSSAFSHGYSTVELNELVALMRRLFRARDLLLKVNLAYIESAAQQDAYRNEPPFKLQGSYRNMTKLAVRITPLLDDDELDALLRDHYRGEAQTLTTGAEENLLKLAELLGTLTDEEKNRWQEIRDEFVRRRKQGGDDADGTQRIANTLLDISRAVDALREGPNLSEDLKEGLAGLGKAIRTLKPKIEVAAPDIAGFGESLKEMRELYTNAMIPLVTATYRKLRMDHEIWGDLKRMQGLLTRMDKLTGSDKSE